MPSPARSRLVSIVLPLLLAACATSAKEPWVPGRPLPPRVLIDVRGKAQARSLSCESRSACDLLAYAGRPTDESTFLEGLPRSDNPELGFVGSVDDPGGGLPPAGYGVYEEPIAARMRELGLPAESVRGVDLAWLKEQLARQRPVIVWATAGLEDTEVVPLRDGRGRTFEVVRYEHTFLAVGYGIRNLFLLDPATGDVREVSAARFDRAWAGLGRRGVVVRGVARPRD